LFLEQQLAIVERQGLEEARSENFYELFIRFLVEKGPALGSSSLSLLFGAVV